MEDFEREAISPGHGADPVAALRLSSCALILATPGRAAARFRNAPAVVAVVGEPQIPMRFRTWTSRCSCDSADPEPESRTPSFNPLVVQKISDDVERYEEVTASNWQCILWQQATSTHSLTRISSEQLAAGWRDQAQPGLQGYPYNPNGWRGRHRLQCTGSTAAGRLSSSGEETSLQSRWLLILAMPRLR